MVPETATIAVNLWCGFSLILQVLEHIIYVVELHQDVVRVRNDEAVCRVGLGIMIKYLEGNSRKNKSYITHMVEYLFSTSVS